MPNKENEKNTFRGKWFRKLTATSLAASLITSGIGVGYAESDLDKFLKEAMGSETTTTDPATDPATSTPPQEVTTPTGTSDSSVYYTTTSEQPEPSGDIEKEAWVQRLKALDIVKGYEDGSLGLDKTITRAEFTALMIRLRNLGAAAEGAKDTQIFSDVSPSDWFAGVVNLGYDLGIVKGHTEGTFEPNTTITYEQAVAIMVRVLGYENTLAGTYPNAHLAKAADLGLTKQIGIKLNQGIPRKDVFRIIDNGLSAPLMEQRSYGDSRSYVTLDGEGGREYKSLLSEHLDVEVIDRDWAERTNSNLPTVTKSPMYAISDLKENEIRLNNTIFKVIDGIDIDSLYGQRVEVWVKKRTTGESEDTILYAAPDLNQKVVTGQVKKVYYNGSEVLEGGTNLPTTLDPEKAEIELLDGSRYYFAVDNVNVNLTKKDLDYLLSSADDQYVKLVLDRSDAVIFADALDYGDTILVDAIEGTTIKSLKGKNLNLSDTKYRVFVDGKLAELKDITAGSVVYFLPTKGKDKDYLIEAYTQKVSGKVEKVTWDGKEVKDFSIEIDGKVYPVAATASISTDKNESVSAVTTDSLKAIEGQDIEVQLGKAGEIQHISVAKETVALENIGTITRPARIGGYGDDVKLTLLTYDNKEVDVTFTLGDLDTILGSSYTKLKGSKTDRELVESLFAVAQEKPVLVKYKYSSNYKLTQMDVIYSVPAGITDEKTLEDVISSEASYLTSDDGAKFDAEDKMITSKDGSYSIRNNTVIFNLTEWDGSSFEASVVDWDAVKNAKGVEFTAVVNDSGTVRYLLITKTDGRISKGGQYGLVQSFSTKSGKDTALIVGTDGTAKEYVLDARRSFEKSDFIRFETNSEGELTDPVILFSWEDKNVPANFDKDAANLDLDPIKIRVDRTYSESIKAKGGGTYKVSDETVYFDLDRAKKIDYIDVDDYVVLIESDDEGGSIDYVLYVDSQENLENTDVIDKGDNWDEFLDDLDEDDETDPDTDPDPGNGTTPDTTLTGLSAVSDGLLITQVTGTIDASAVDKVLVDGIEASISGSSFNAVLVDAPSGKTLTVEAYKGATKVSTKTVVVGLG